MIFFLFSPFQHVYNLFLNLLCASDVKDNSLVDPGIFQQGARYIFFRSGDRFDGHAP